MMSFISCEYVIEGVISTLPLRPALLQLQKGENKDLIKSLIV